LESKDKSGKRQVSKELKMINVRTKGATFERQIVNSLNHFFYENGLGVRCKRNLEQYQAKEQCDIDIPFHAIECKSYKEGNWYRPEWWRQVVKSANGRIPALVYKFNRTPVKVCVPLAAINTDWHFDVDQTAVLMFDEWLKVLQRNWQSYINQEASTSGSIRSHKAA
jgi:Holliday junction resolvase|tara:strand:+ start:902 stop:1402 length:501 start_codon:yes stop_codon:yes gene_type:complete